MAELITLAQGDISATIDPQGAWLTQLQISGRDILFPRQTFTLPDGSSKVRGGSHVCFPNFGPGGDSGLPQHGFARTSRWQVARQSANRVELVLEGVDGDYDDAEVRLTYELLENGIGMSLYVENQGSDVLPICPAFHPYYATTASESVVDGKHYDHTDLAEARFLNGPVEGLMTGGVRFEVRQQNLSQWVLWTDSLGDYVCLESTAVGNGFEEGTTLQLAVGGSWSGSLTIACAGS
jgi:D-hexose-6-phosphate mutarotase